MMIPFHSREQKGRALGISIARAKLWMLSAFLHLSVAQSRSSIRLPVAAHIEDLILFPPCHCTEAWGSQLRGALVARRKTRQG